MAIRIPWDIYESVLLLDSYIEIKNGDLARSEGINQLSSDLRKLAISRGYEIDDIYRNINGITLQMQKIAYVFSKGEDGLAGASNIFVEACRLYEEDPQQYKKTLMEAKSMVGQDTSSNVVVLPHTNRNKYQDWLIKDGLSSFAARNYGNWLNKLADYVMDNGYSTESVYDIGNIEILLDLHEVLCKNEEFVKEHRDYITSFRKFITYRSNGEIIIGRVRAASSQSNSNMSEREAFQDWLVSTGLSPEIARSYGARLNRIDEYAITNGFSTKSVYEMESSEDIFSLYEILNQDKDMPPKSRDCLTGLRRYITYRSDGEINLSQSRSSLSYGDETGEKRAAYQKWLVDNGLVSAAARNYGNWLNKINVYSVDNGYSSKSIYDIETIEELNQLFSVLNEVQELIDNHRDYLTSMKKYILYRNEQGDLAGNYDSGEIGNIENPKCDQKEELLISEKELSQCAEVLSEHFSEGLVLNAIRLDKFRMLYEDLFDAQLTDNDDDLILILKNVGTYVGDRILPKHDSFQNEIIEEIISEVNLTLRGGARCVYLSCIFDRWQSELATQLNVYNQESLKALLKEHAIEGLVITDFVVKNTWQKVYPEENVIEYMKASHGGVSYQLLKASLWYIPIETIKRTLVYTSEIALIDAETYYYAPNFPASPEELYQLTKLMRERIFEKGFLVSRDIYEIIKEKCHSLAINTEGFKDWAYRNILKYLLRDEFEFGGSIVSEKGQKMEMYQVYRSFCRDYEHLTLDELNRFSEEVGVQIYWDSVLTEMVRISSSEFVRRDKIIFPHEEIDNVLDEMCQGEYVPLKDIGLYLHFPSIEVPWNIFVLESYLLESKHFSLYHSSFSKQDVFGLAVRKNSKFDNYEDVVVDLLAHDNEWTTAADALEIIVQRGCQARRRWENFEKVLLKASNYREELIQKGE